MKARIVRDNWAGYEVQFWRWWFPFWTQGAHTNTHNTVEQARIYANRRLHRVIEEVT